MLIFYILARQTFYSSHLQVNRDNNTKESYELLYIKLLAALIGEEQVFLSLYVMLNRWNNKREMIFQQHYKAVHKGGIFSDF